MCTVALAPLARSPRWQVRVLEVMEQVAAALPPSTAQLSPVPEGSGSLRVTERATPGPELLTVMVKPMGSPVLTGVASGILVTLRLGAWTTMVPLPEAELPLVGVAVAVFR